MIKKFFIEIIYGKRCDAIAKLFLVPLFFFSQVYRFILLLRHVLYVCRIFRVKSLPCRVISVGNITLGGAGKSPLVAFLSEQLKKKGYGVVVLSRGYKREGENQIDIVSDEQRILLSPSHAGDEPYMLAKKLKGIPVVVGKNRHCAGKLAVDKFRPDVLILDDGFQHVQLKRDMNILLIDSTQGAGGYRLFPMGVLREPLKGMKRSDIVLFTKYDPLCEPNLEQIKNCIPDKIPVYHSSFESVGLVESDTGSKKDAGFLENKKVIAVCGIGNPESFRASLEALKADIKAFLVFPDHHDYTAKEIKKIENLFQPGDIDLVVTTEKDGVRLLKYLPVKFPLFELAVRIRVEEEKALEQGLLSFVENKAQKNF